jgi:hypothetical protein
MSGARKLPYSLPKFQDQKAPTEYEIYRGPLKMAPPFNKMKVLVKEGNKEVEKTIEVDEIKDYDSMDVYQKALPGQGFATIFFEKKSEDGKRILVELLIPAFNKDDGREEHRKHLQRLGIPYVESTDPLGKNTGMIHTRTSRMLGIQTEKQENQGLRMGGGIFKPYQKHEKGRSSSRGEGDIVFRSQSQNAAAVELDEYFLLAHALDKYNKVTGYDSEFFYRRLMPEDIALPSAQFLKVKIQQYANLHKDDKNYPFLDDGEWLTDKIQKLPEEGQYKNMRAWNDVPEEIKKAQVINTLFRTIELGNLKGFTDRNKGAVNPTFLTRILSLNKEKKLGLDLNNQRNGKTPLMQAVKEKLPEVVKQLCKESSVRVDELNSNNETALMLAAESGNLEITKLLLEAKADPNRALPAGAASLPALVRAAKKGHTQIVKLLLEKKAEQANTALIAAVINGRKNVIEILLKLSSFCSH